MEQENEKLELVYGLEDKPSPLETAYAALQHLLAIIVGIITPTLIIGGVLGLGERIPYLISMSLIGFGCGYLHSGQKNWTSRFRFVECSGN